MKYNKIEIEYKIKKREYKWNINNKQLCHQGLSIYKI